MKYQRGEKSKFKSKFKNHREQFSSREKGATNAGREDRDALNYERAG